MKTVKKYTAFILVFCLLFSTAGCSKALNENSPGTNGLNDQTNNSPDYDDILKKLEAQAAVPVQAADYEEVRANFVLANEKQEGTTENAGNDGFIEDTVTDGTQMPTQEDFTLSYSETNTQVDGVDEADIIKTDGNYIYAISGAALQIIHADGAQTALCSEIFIEAEEDEDIYPIEMFISGQMLYVLAQKTIWSESETSWNWKDITQILAYDVSDPMRPVLKSIVGQDGSYKTSRMIDGSMYVVTEKYLYHQNIEEDNEWIPHTYCDGIAAMIAPNDIYICLDNDFEAFTIIGAYDCAENTFAATYSFTGTTDCVYMSRNAIYIAQVTSKEFMSEPYTEKQYSVIDYETVSTTQIHRIRIKDGKLLPDGSGTVNGCLLNQYAMDEYNDMLRVATTTYYSSYSVYTDETYQFNNSVMRVSETNNALFVLDTDMKTLGNLNNLVENETIYSVRFTDQIAYVVTFEQNAPVLTIDLSDPEHPELLGALEVSGVSNYLQGYGEGLMLGFGEALNTEAESGGLQLSMFDTTDPKNVQLLTKTVIDDWYSEGLSNHKAMLISSEKNIIAFPGAANRYYVYGYADGQFVEWGTFKIDLSGSEILYWDWSSVRGLFIDNELYLICDQQIIVADMMSYDVVAEFSLAKG